MIIIPLYKFHCNYCNVDETVTKKMSQYNPEEPCLVCGKPMVRKIEDMVTDYVCKCDGFYGKKSN